MRAFGRDTKVCEAFFRVVVMLGSVQECLRWYAAYISASTTEHIIFLYDRDLHAQLGRTYGSDIAAGARTYHYDIIN
jgi:hypothetical protein